MKSTIIFRSSVKLILHLLERLAQGSGKPDVQLPFYVPDTAMGERREYFRVSLAVSFGV